MVHNDNGRIQKVVFMIQEH